MTSLRIIGGRHQLLLFPVLSQDKGLSNNSTMKSVSLSEVSSFLKWGKKPEKQAPDVFPEIKKAGTCGKDWFISKFGIFLTLNQNMTQNLDFSQSWRHATSQLRIAFP